jgi:hypothetical protein
MNAYYTYQNYNYLADILNFDFETHSCFEDNFFSAIMVFFILTKLITK